MNLIDAITTGLPLQRENKGWISKQDSWKRVEGDFYDYSKSCEYESEDGEVDIVFDSVSITSNKWSVRLPNGLIVSDLVIDRSIPTKRII